MDTDKILRKMKKLKEKRLRKTEQVKRLLIKENNLKRKLGM